MNPHDLPTVYDRATLLLMAATLVDDQTLHQTAPRQWSQTEGDKLVSNRLRHLAQQQYKRPGPIGGTGVRLRIPPFVRLFLLRYMAYMETLGLYAVSVSISDEGEVTWRERADALMKEFVTAGVRFEDKKILSIGVNTGGDLMALLEMGARSVLGIDSINELVIFTSALFTLGDVDPARWRLLTSNAETFTSSPVDVVYNVGVLYHVENPMSVLRRSFESLKPGGWLVLETEVADNLEGAEGHMVFWPQREPQHIEPSISSPMRKNWLNWWVPRSDVVETMLKTCGFVEVAHIPTVIAKGAFVARRPEGMKS